MSKKRKNPSQRIPNTTPPSPQMSNEKSSKFNNLKSWLINSGMMLLHSLTILFILAVIICLLFYVPPKRSYINLAIESNQPNIHNSSINECSFSTKKAVFTDLEQFSISFVPVSTTQTQMKLDGSDGVISVPVTILSNYAEINGEEFKDGDIYELVIKPKTTNDQSQKPKIVIETKDSRNLFSWEINKANKETPCNALTCNKTSVSMDGIVQECKISGYDKSYNNRYGIIKGFELQSSFSSCSVELYCNGDLLREYDDIDPLFVSFPCFRSMDLVINGANGSFTDVMDFKCKISQIHDLDLFGDGNVTVLYRPNPDNYTILQQPIGIRSQDGSFLSAEINQPKHELNYDGTIENVIEQIEQAEKSYTFSLSAYGFVDEIRLANISLLPDIFSWFRENVYLLPASIITIILGSIEFIKLKDKKKGKDET